MTDYVLKISSYRGIVPGATHLRGRVEEPYPESCHGGMSYNASSARGEYSCAKGHIIPRRIEWDVEEPWTEKEIRRFSARKFEADGPGQFASRRHLINVAIGRFCGYYLPRWFEEKPVIGQPGDRLYYHWLPGMVLLESFTEEERKRRDGLPLPGDLLVEIPAIRRRVFYVTVMREPGKPGRGTGLLLGPYRFRDDAEADVELGRKLGGEIDQFAHFYGFGVTGLELRKGIPLPQGSLNAKRDERRVS